MFVIVILARARADWKNVSTNNIIRNMSLKI